MSKHFKDNQRVLINELRDCKAETGLTFSEVCKEKLAEFTNDATTRQIRMQHDLEEATYAQADQMHSVMEEHHRQLLGNRRHHIMVRLLEEKDHEVRALQQQVDALKDTNNRLKYEQMVSGVRPDIDALRECINEKSSVKAKIDVLYNFNHDPPVSVGVRDWISRRLQHHLRSKTKLPFALRPIGDMVVD